MIYKLTGNNNYGLLDIGGKANSINTLNKLGFRVPKSFSLSAKSLSETLLQNDINVKYPQLIDIYRSDPVKCFMKLKDIGDKIRDITLSDEIFQNSDEYEELAKITPKGLAVRSSAIMEDGSEHSFAGCFSSYFGATDLSSLKDFTKMCIASSVTPQVIAYMANRNIKEEFNFSVLIQEIIKSEKGGVCFTRNPVNGSDDEVYIEANWGSGISVVEGDVDVDKYHVTKIDLTTSVDVGEKSKYTQMTAHGVCKHNSSDQTENAACLNTNNIKLLLDAGKSLEKYYASAVDFEWAISNEQLYLLQVRPITA